MVVIRNMLITFLIVFGLFCNSFGSDDINSLTKKEAMEYLVAYAYILGQESSYERIKLQYSDRVRDIDEAIQSFKASIIGKKVEKLKQYSKMVISKRLKKQDAKLLKESMANKISSMNVEYDIDLWLREMEQKEKGEYPDHIIKIIQRF